MSDMTMDDSDVHPDHPDKAGEHLEAMNFLDPSDASHVAVSDGDWSDPATWRDGRVPGSGADVHIPAGISVEYDVSSDARLHYVRVDGTLDWATDTDTRMVVDTVIGTPTSTLTVGTADNPVPAGTKAEIVFVDRALDAANDPELLSLGFIAHGRIETHGAAKEAYLPLAEAPMAGDNKIAVEGDASGWQVGDDIVIMGTKWAGKDANGVLRTQDEERKIVAIEDGVITLDAPLVHDHATPAGYDLDSWVGNASRNVEFSSENPEGTRGHFMVMHSPDAEIRYSEFNELGRTDKSEPLNVGENVEGRYSLHFHRTGAQDGAEMAVATGNAVVGSPGWGIVHHDSTAAIDYNFVYDIVGAGIVSEDGNERGQWIGNFVLKVVGDGEDFSISRDEKEADFGHEGVGYENQSRLVVQQDNIAANVQTAWMFRPAQVGAQSPDREALQFDPNPLGYEIDHNDPQFVAFNGNTAAVVEVGMDTGHRGNMKHSTRHSDHISDIREFTVWEAGTAVDLFNYTKGYTFSDSLWLGRGGGTGLNIPAKSEGTSLVDVTIDGFDYGIRNNGLNTEGMLVDVQFKNIDRAEIDSDVIDMKVIDGSSVTAVDAPTLRLDGDADVSISPSDSHIYLKGDVTDSLGTYRFASNHWGNGGSMESHYDGLETDFGTKTALTLDELFSLHGTLRDAEGNWSVPLTFWITDRLTGEHHATTVEIELTGFDPAYLEQFRMESFEAPNSEVTVLNTRSPIPGDSDGDTSGGGTPTTGDGSTDSGGDASDPDSGTTDPGDGDGTSDSGDGTTGSGDGDQTPDSGDGTTDSGDGDQTPDSGDGTTDGGDGDGTSDSDDGTTDSGDGDQTPDSDDGTADGDDPTNGDGSSGDGTDGDVSDPGGDGSGTETVFAMDGTHRFDGSAGSVVERPHDPALAFGSGAISLSFNADTVKGRAGLFSKDANKLGEGGHLTLYIKNGELVARLQDTDGSTYLSTPVVAGRSYDVTVSFGEGGAALHVDGEEVAADPGFGTGWENNAEFVQIGAAGWKSGSERDGFQEPFSGTISDVRIVAGAETASATSSGGTAGSLELASSDIGTASLTEASAEESDTSVTDSADQGFDFGSDGGSDPGGRDAVDWTPWLGLSAGSHALGELRDLAAGMAEGRDGQPSELAIFAGLASSGTENAADRAEAAGPTGLEPWAGGDVMLVMALEALTGGDGGGPGRDGSDASLRAEDAWRSLAEAGQFLDEAGWPAGDLGVLDLG